MSDRPLTARRIAERGDKPAIDPWRIAGDAIGWIVAAIIVLTIAWALISTYI